MVQKREDEEEEIVLHMSPNHLCCMTIPTYHCYCMLYESLYTEECSWYTIDSK